ncbi:SRPBCC family protein [Amycolatopsis acidiphila]|uniref:Polyketide cyclase n=1 Tax=Amycolatopsis acidiphila TaxID=715473 RepID=A0A558A891_9PSEU|nr:SRPBCC family protein [Amycolatopsis acidiphila]TVT20484.1 polyketide cyclase [Amycolatopsis acidiphila]UIJ57009.1 SRPBCC family protein [Amycolatopsis acidiphila]GHG53857.1 hypothetical protein GCM10017788_02950 [Amycolatopsis acidiphila]
MRYETSVRIHAPAELVWTVLRDVADWPAWTSTVDELHRLDDGPLAVGNKARLKQPKMNTLVWEVTELEPDRSFVWRTGGPGYGVVAGHYVTPDDDSGSRAVLTLEMTGLLAPLLGLLTGARSRRYVDTEAASLKRRCEQRA